MAEIIYQQRVDRDMLSTRAALETALKKRSFGILTEVNVAEVMKKKGVDFERELLLLGVCNPNYAKEVLNINDDVAVMLPCSVVIAASDGGSLIKLAKPTLLVDFFDQEELAEFGRQVEDLLKAAIDEVSGNE